MNGSTSSVLKVEALAGTGKTLLAGFLLEAIMPTMIGTDESVVILVPSRVLRDELVQSRDCMGAFAARSDTGSQVLWLGRPATGQGSNALWDAELTRMVEERLAGPREELHQEEKNILEHHRHLSQFLSLIHI